MKEELNDLIINIQLIDDDILKAEKIKKTLRLLNSSKEEDYYLFYLKGYLWNLYPFDSKEREESIEYNLKKSIKLNQNYIYSKTELSFFYFDQNRYSKVIKFLSELDLSFFEKNNQTWKSIKLQELLLISKLHLVEEINQDLYDEFINLTFLYSSLPEENIAVPRELVYFVLNNNKVGISRIISQLNLLINTESMKDYFDDDVKYKLKEMLK